jgi:hypothetical protein
MFNPFILFKILIKIYKFISHILFFFSDKINHNKIYYKILKNESDEWSNGVKKVNGDNKLNKDGV